MTAAERKSFLEEHIPYRMLELSFCQIMCVFLSENSTEHPLTIHLGKLNKLCSPNLRLLTNPIIETGLITSRVMLEFLGIKATQGILPRLVERKVHEKHIDLACEDFKVPPLTLAGLRKILHEQPPLDAEKAMANTIVAAKNGVAHIALDEHPRLEIHHLAVTCHVTNLLLNCYFYESLHMPYIDLHEVSARK